MQQPVLELEGRWEEILEHAAELAGCKVRVVVLPPEEEPHGIHPSKALEPLPELEGRVPEGWKDDFERLYRRDMRSASS